MPAIKGRFRDATLVAVELKVSWIFSQSFPLLYAKTAGFAPKGISGKLGVARCTLREEIP